MDWFFDQWIYHGGHPELSVSTEYDTEKGMLTMEVEQTQTVDEVTPLFRFPLDIEWVAGSARNRVQYEVRDKSTTFYIPMEDRPDYVLIDPDGWLMAEVDHEQSTSALLAQAKDKDRVLARRSAIAQLGEKTQSDEILATLTFAMRTDSQVGIRTAAADALAELGGDDARDSIMLGLNDADPNVRNRVVYALGTFEGDDVAFQALARIAGSNDIEPIRGSAIDAASMVDPERAASMASAAIGRRSEKYTIETDAFTALRRLNDEERIPIAMRYTRPGNPTAVRISAVGFVGAMAKYEKDENTRHRYSRELEQYLDDRNMNFRKPVMRAIGALGRPGAVAGLERVLRQSVQVSEWETAENAIKAIREKKPEESPNAVARQLDEEQDARKKLEEKIEELEERIDAVMENKGRDESSPK